MSKHTAGPWKVWQHPGENLYVDSENHGSVCKIAEKDIPTWLGERDANARLIAAAPELLEALEAARTEMLGLSCYLETCAPEIITENLPSLIASLRKKYEMAEAAIRKAQGEQVRS